MTSATECLNPLGMAYIDLIYLDTEEIALILPEREPLEDRLGPEAKKHTGLGTQLGQGET